ncbi:MAG: phosphotransferase [Dissulfurispiraceae bacterium]
MSVRKQRSGGIGAVFSSGAEALGIIKLGESRLNKEAEALKTLASIEFHESNSLRVQVPKLLYSGDLNSAYLIVESVPQFHGNYAGADFNLKYAELLKILFDHAACSKPFLDSTFYRSMKRRIINYPFSHQQGLIRALDCIEEELRGKEVYFGVSHGDFKPRNMLWDQDRVFVFDWAAMSLEAPFGIDFVHFLFRTGWKEHHKRKKKLYDYITGNDKEGRAAYHLFEKKVGNLICEPKVIVLLYLIDKFPYYKTETVDKRKKVLIDLLEIALDHFSHD